LPSVLQEVDQSAFGAAVDRLASSFEDAALEISERVIGVSSVTPEPQLAAAR
jgi:hypothetical protein